MHLVKSCIICAALLQAYNGREYGEHYYHSDDNDGYHRNHHRRGQRSHSHTTLIAIVKERKHLASVWRALTMLQHFSRSTLQCHVCSKKTLAVILYAHVIHEHRPRQQSFAAFPGSRQRRYAEHLEGGLDGRSDSYSDSDSYSYSPRRSSYTGRSRGHRQAPSATLHVRVCFSL